MNMKKSAIAVAVTGAIAAPMSASAAEAYGSINTAIESTSEDNGGAGVIYNTNSEEESFSMADTWESRFGFTGGEDLGGGLEASYKYEFGLSTSSVGNGSVNEDTNVQTRLSWVALSGGFGQIKLGTQWGVIYEYAGWNIYRTDQHGGAGHYYMTNGTAFSTGPDDLSGLRADNTIKYTYGGGGYSSDPFTFSVAIRSAAGSSNTSTNGATVADEEGIDNVTVGAQGTVGPVTINGVLYSEQNTQPDGAGEVREPSLFTLGARANIGPAYVGGTFYSGDRDTDDNENPTALQVLGGMDFGGGTMGHVGFSTGDNDADTDAGNLTAFFLQAEHNFSSRTKIYGEFESATLDGGNADDSTTDTFALGVKHSF